MNWTTLWLREEKSASFQMLVLFSVDIFSQWSTLVKQTDIGMPNTFMCPWMNWTLQEEKSASFQTNQVERENHKPRPTSIQCSSIIFMHFFKSFRKTGRVKLQGFTDLLAPIKTDRFTTRYYIYVYDNLGNIRRRWYQIGEATSSHLRPSR